MCLEICQVPALSNQTQKIKVKIGLKQNAAVPKAMEVSRILRVKYFFMQLQSNKFWWSELSANHYLVKVPVNIL